MRRALVTAGATLLAAVLAACGVEVSGKVLDKSYEPGHYTVVMIPQYTTLCRPSGANGATTCSQQFSHYLPMNQWIPDDYNIQVLDDTSHKTHWVDVSAGDYESIKVGDHFSNKDGS